MQAHDPIGVFDSGVGGLSVLQEIRKALPGENLLYVADSAFAPYGDKSEEMIIARSLAIAEFLKSQHVKAIVVACNTATGAAVSTLRHRFSCPIVAMEPAIKPAALQTKSKVIGVLATRRTLSSTNFVKLFERYGADVEILAQACTGFVEQVEAGDLASVKTHALVERYLSPLLQRGADTIVLGCTHYPFLRPLIKEIAGPEVTIIDSSEAVARELRRRLASQDLLSPAAQVGTESFWSSDQPAKTGPVISMLWKTAIEVSPFGHSDSIPVARDALPAF